MSSYLRGFVAAVALAALAPVAQAQPIEPRIVIGLDTSGSAVSDLCNTGAFADDTLECPGADVACVTCGAAGCGNAVADDSVLWKAKTATAQTIGSASPGINFALARMHQDPVAFACGAGGWAGGGPSCSGAALGGGSNAADILVGFGPGNEAAILEWINFTDDHMGGPPPDTGCTLCGTCGGGCDKEARGSGASPVAGSLFSIGQYVDQQRMADPLAMCRPYAVVLFVDGGDNCNAADEPATQAAALCDAGVPVHVAAFGACPLGCGDPCFADCPAATCPTANDACTSDCSGGCTKLAAAVPIATAGCGPACDRASTGDPVCTGATLFDDDEAGLAMAIGGVLAAVNACGDGCCTGDETPCNCGVDCPESCGDGCCTGTETPCDCPADCSVDALGDGCCHGSETACDETACADSCADGCCTGPETPCSCAAECTSDVSGDGCCSGAETSCDDAACSDSCGDGCCGGTEDKCGCAADCPADDCGDGCCTGAETPCACAGDCTTDVPGDGCCSGTETPCDDGACVDSCADGCCGPTEDKCGCPTDCLADDCGDGCCTGAETPCSCAAECTIDAPGDGCCHGTETACDEAACPDSCGDGCCTGAETPCDCASECTVDVPGDGCCSGAETGCDDVACDAACGDGCCTGTEDCAGCGADCGDCPDAAAEPATDLGTPPADGESETTPGGTGNGGGCGCRIGATPSANGWLVCLALVFARVRRRPRRSRTRTGLGGSGRN